MASNFCSQCSGSWNRGVDGVFGAAVGVFDGVLRGLMSSGVGFFTGSTGFGLTTSGTDGASPLGLRSFTGLGAVGRDGGALVVILGVFGVVASFDAWSGILKCTG